MSIVDVNVVTNCIGKIKSTLVNGGLSVEQLRDLEKSIGKLHLDIDARLDELEENNAANETDNVEGE